LAASIRIAPFIFLERRYFRLEAIPFREPTSRGFWWEISPPPRLIEEIQQKCGVNGPFGFYGNEHNNQRLDSCVIRSADLYQDFVAELLLPLTGLDFRRLAAWEGRILAHGEEESSGRSYLMLELSSLCLLYTRDGSGAK
jgi:hypothetical protein